jgi:hypothetical protein
MAEFKFKLGDKVKLTQSEENGVVISRAEHQNHCNQYSVRYKAGDGRVLESWWDEDALEAA